VRKAVGGWVPVYGATAGEGWDLAAKGAAVRHWEAKQKNCVKQERRRTYLKDVERKRRGNQARRSKGNHLEEL